MKKKNFGKSVSLVLSAALTVTMGSFPVSAENMDEGYEAAFMAEEVVSEEAASQNEEPVQEIGTETEENTAASQEEQQETDFFFGDAEDFDAEDFVSEDSVPLEEFDSESNLSTVQAGLLSEVYLDPANGNDGNSGENAGAAVKTYDHAKELLNKNEDNGIIYLLSTLEFESSGRVYWVENVEFKPVDSSLAELIHVKPNANVIFSHVKASGSYLNDSEKNSKYPILIEGNMTIKDNSVIGPFPGQGNVQVKAGTLELMSGEIIGTGDPAYQTNYSCGVYVTNKASVNMSGGVIRNHASNFGAGMQVWNESTVTLTGGEIKNNIGSGICVRESKLIMNATQENPDGCYITDNIYRDNAGSGGGIYLSDSFALINAGCVQNNKAYNGGGIAIGSSNVAIAGNASILGNQTSFGGGLFIFDSKVTLGGNSKICNNRAEYSGGVLLDNSEMTISENAQICENTVTVRDAGISASHHNYENIMLLGYETQIKITGGVIKDNYIICDESHKKEEACNLNRDSEFVNLKFSGSPEISGDISLDDLQTGGPMLFIEDKFTPVYPLVLNPRYGTAGVKAVHYADNLTVDENYKDIFTVPDGFNRELEQDGHDLKWIDRARVEFEYTTSSDLERKEGKTLWISPGTVLDPSEIPEAAVIPGYTRIGWISAGASVPPQYEENIELCDLTAPITIYTGLKDVWVLDKPEVTIAKDKDISCPAVPITLTAKATHEISDTLSYTYQWYKDGEELEDVTDAIYKASEEGEYTVKVTAYSEITEKASSATESVELPAFEHDYDYEFDENTHWQVCDVNGEITEKEAHVFGDWEVTDEATIEEEGEKERSCDICGYVETEAIPALPKPTPTATPVPTSTPTPTPTPVIKAQKVKTGVGLKSSVKKNSITLKWSKTKDADGYMIYGAKCGSSYKLLKTVKGSTAKWTHKKLKSGTYYKYYVVGYKLVDGKKVTISKTVRIHVATPGRGFGYARKLQLNRSKVTLKPGKSAAIKAKLLYSDGCIDNHVAIIRHYSSNSRVATVNSKGVIKAKRKGTCTIYYYAQNGLCKKVKVTVK